ncbi:MmgE/PrpD family protein, partial [Chloroflexota bacterium]
MSDTLTQTLGRFAHSLRYEDLPAEVVEKSKILIMHGIGVGLGGFNTEIGQIGIEVAKKMAGGSAGEATILVDGSKISPAAAVLANTAMFHSLFQDDSYEPGGLHIGPTVTPTALAV